MTVADENAPVVMEVEDYGGRGERGRWWQRWRMTVVEENAGGGKKPLNRWAYPLNCTQNKIK